MCELCLDVRSPTGGEAARRVGNPRHFVLGAGRRSVLRADGRRRREQGLLRYHR